MGSGLGDLKDFSHSIGLSGKGCHRSAKPSGGEDLDIEEPVACRDSPAFHFHPTQSGMLGATLIRYQVVQVGQAREKRLLAAPRDDESLSWRTVSARSRYRPDPRACWSPVSVGLRAPHTSPAVWATWSAKWRNRWPNANTRKPLRWRARDNKVWNWERKVVRT